MVVERPGERLDHVAGEAVGAGPLARRRPGSARSGRRRPTAASRRARAPPPSRTAARPRPPARRAARPAPRRTAARCAAVGRLGLVETQPPCASTRKSAARMSLRVSSVSRGPRPVAPTIRMPAARTRSRTSWVYADTVSSLRTRVPSRSVAMSLGRPGLTIGYLRGCDYPRGGRKENVTPAQLPAAMTSGSRPVSVALANGFEHVPAAEERLQRLGHPHRAVRLLVVLQDRDQPAGGRQRAVQRGRRSAACRPRRGSGCSAGAPGTWCSSTSR